MATATKPGTSVRVTINKSINRASARKTLERLFMMDKAVHGPMNARSRNFKELPRRRGGCIWTKAPTSFTLNSPKARPPPFAPHRNICVI